MILLPKELGQRIILRNYPSLDTFKVISANNYKSFGHIKLSPDNKIVSVRDKDWRLVLIDIETGEERVLYDFLAKYGNTQYAPAQVNTWDFNIDGTEIAIVGSYHIPPTKETYAGDFIYDLVADSVIHIIGQKGDLRYSPDGSVLALIDQGKKGYYIELYDTQNYQFIKKIEMNTSAQYYFTISNDNKYLITAIKDGQRGLHVYDLFEKKMD
jgi:WD40 repeat protein